MRMDPCIGGWVGRREGHLVASFISSFSFYQLTLVHFLLCSLSRSNNELLYLFHRSEGLYPTFTDQDTVERDFFEQAHGRKIDLFIVTNPEVIVGIGDQGVGVPLGSRLCSYGIRRRPGALRVLA
ncbi:hypothetical protein BDQ17DRAFT_817972 [Cyathus striatus]|nr:hypothetical protein BDQ17DRAFT_817972 [Cyathus striatus]